MNRSRYELFTRKLLCFLSCCLCISAAAAEEVNLLSFGDWGWSNSPEQQACAKQMAAYSASNHIRFDAALLLGDNFYQKLPGGVNDPRWEVEFEQAYDPEFLDMPFYAALGNHTSFILAGGLDVKLPSEPGLVSPAVCPTPTPHHAP